MSRGPGTPAPRSEGGRRDHTVLPLPACLLCGTPSALAILCPACLSRKSDKPSAPVKESLYLSPELADSSGDGKNHPHRTTES